MSKKIHLDLKDCYSLNEIFGLYSSRRGGAKAAFAKRSKAVESIRKQTEDAVKKGITFDWPSALLFEWHIPNEHRDPDNVSSGGRKAIFDGWQKTKIDDDKMFLPNDNHKHLRGFIDRYVYGNSIKDKEIYVDIYQINEDVIDELKEMNLDAK